ncbi:hypothetical protein [Paenibacillus aestuarii]|uniref:IS110 family transposase n=1 Tax=Paenibacillus aestuarii TaxID=516965 RepID=A0ABW0K9Q2_9BACL|nr:hypothetical protein [Paenibacillus aestuarii]
MKFKQNDVQNQRIEHITSYHLVVGIDIAKETQVARTVTFRGIELGRPCSFKNDDVGFQKLLIWIKSIQKQHLRLPSLVSVAILQAK